MIVAAYAGAGKTSFAKRTAGAIDLVTMPYSRILPPDDGAKREHEGEKAAPYLLQNPQYPYNYLLEVLKAEQEYDYVLIPTSAGVIRILDDMRRQVVLCYPTREQREDYRARFLARGNSEEFLEVFVERWEDFLTPFWERRLNGIHIPLQRGQFLNDVKAAIDAAGSGQRPPVQEAVLRELEKKTTERRSAVLYLSIDVSQSCVYPIRDIEDPEERRFLYRISRMIYEVTYDLPHVFDLETWEAIKGINDIIRGKTAIYAGDRAAVLHYLKEAQEHLPALLRRRASEMWN